ncbi:DUF4157 domain-containing protein [Nostoc sp. WHI]|nr:DUF4157 domain-containing protein [Nostoc sp. WHI]
MERAKAQPNLLEILIRNSQATQTTESQAPVQSNTIQAKGETTGDRPDSSVEQRPNKTGMPNALKAGVESLSGYALDDVRVHYNSPKTAQLQALAYTQGTEIHVAPGQEEHLPHEAWHVVQQFQGRVKPTMQIKGLQINDDEGLEREADVRGEQARSGATQPKENPVLKSEAKVGSKMVQKRDRTAVVVWDVTHEVIPEVISDEESLFGDGSNPFKNEGIELYRGEKIIVDDKDIFQSRRGANQENQERRENDKVGHLTNKWLKLKRVEEREISGKGYVREETIKIAKDTAEIREIIIELQKSKSAKKAVDTIHNAWEELREKRRMSKGAWEIWEEIREKDDKETSPSWDQIEEGYDVSKQLSNSAPEEYDNYSVEEDGDQAIFTASDKETRTPIGIIIIENRATTKFPGDGDNPNKRWYLRWLLGHPTLKGAGGLLLGKALDYVKTQGGKAVWVESAPSAMGWYKDKKFNPLEEEIQKKYNIDFKEGWDSVLMVLDFEQM